MAVYINNEFHMFTDEVDQVVDSILDNAPNSDVVYTENECRISFR